MDDELRDDPTVVEMRRPDARRTISFMAPGELLHIRREVLLVPQARLCEQLIDPTDGEACSTTTLSRWERGSRPVPLWAARRIRDLAEAAKNYDERT